MAGRIALYSAFLLSVVGLLVALVVIDQAVHFAGYGQPAQAISPSTLTTSTWGVFNPETGQLLVASNEDEVRPIASVTKLFTALAVMESEKKDELFVPVYSDITTEGRSGKLAYGETYTPYQLLFPLLIESSNDAGEAIRRVLREDFVESNTRVRTELDLASTEIVDGSGLSPEDVSSIRDLARFYSYLKRTHPHVLDITQLRMYVNGRTGYVSNNPARELSSFTGGKNGYTPEAGRTFVGTFRREDGTEVGVVLLGSSDVLGDIEAILALASGTGR